MDNRFDSSDFAQTTVQRKRATQNVIEKLNLVFRLLRFVVAFFLRHLSDTLHLAALLSAYYAVQYANCEHKQCGRCFFFSVILHLRFLSTHFRFTLGDHLPSFALCRSRTAYVYVSFRQTTRIWCAIYFSFLWSWGDVECWLQHNTHVAWNDFAIHLFHFIRRSVIRRSFQY